MRFWKLWVGMALLACLAGCTGRQEPYVSETAPLSSPAAAIPSASATPEPMQESEVIAFDLANTYFSWAYQGMQEDFFVEYLSEITVSVEGETCLLFRAGTDAETLCEAAVTPSADRLFIRYSSDAPWQQVEEEVWNLIDSQAY